MNTNNHRTHRHIVAIPLLAVVLLGITKFGGGPASLVEAESSHSTDAVYGAGQTFSLSSGTVGMVGEFGSLEIRSNRPSLLEGGALVSSEGPAWMQAGELSVLGFHGGFFVSREGEGITVAALTTPVLARHGDFLFLVPQGMQGAWPIATIPSTPDTERAIGMLDALSPMDEEFLKQQIRQLDQLPTSEETLAPEAHKSFLPLGFLMFQSAQDRNQEYDFLSALTELQKAVRLGDAVALNAILETPGMHEYLQSSIEAQRFLPSLLRDAVARPANASSLLPYVHDADLWLLSSLDADLWSASWLSERASVEDSSVQELRLMLFPASDTLPEAAPDLVAERWATQLAESLQGSQNRDEVLQQLFAAMTRYFATLEERGYPERMDRYLTLLDKILAPVADSLNEGMKAQLLAWDEHVRPELAEVQTEGENASSEGSTETAPEGTLDLAALLSQVGAHTETNEVSPEDSDILVAKARALLTDAGAIFTTQTRFEVQSGKTVIVQGIVFASPDGEHVFDFEFTPSTSSLDRIYRDSKKLLFGLSLEGFLTWVRGEQSVPE